MGTMITLGVGKLEINWGKNDIFEDEEIQRLLKKYSFWESDKLILYLNSMSCFSK